MTVCFAERRDIGWVYKRDAVILEGMGGGGLGERRDRRDRNVNGDLYGTQCLLSIYYNILCYSVRAMYIYLFAFRSATLRVY